MRCLSSSMSSEAILYTRFAHAAHKNCRPSGPCVQPMCTSARMAIAASVPAGQKSSCPQVETRLSGIPSPLVATSALWLWVLAACACVQHACSYQHGSPQPSTQSTEPPELCSSHSLTSPLRIRPHTLFAFLICLSAHSLSAHSLSAHAAVIL